jgi:hypothetical protein
MRYSFMKHILYKFTVLIILIITGVRPNSAQTNFDITIEFNNIFRVGYFAWAFDNQTFVFFNDSLSEDPIPPDLEASQPLWQTFNVETGVLTPGQTRYPLQPVLDTDEITLFNPYNLILPSPDNNNLLAFSSRQPNNPYYLTFANRTTDQFIQTSLLTNGNPFFRSEGLLGNWSEEGNIFIYSQGNSFTTEATYFQIRVDESDLLNTTLVQFAPMIEGEVYGLFDVIDRYLDLSTNGDNILAIARREYDELPYLVVWTPDANPNGYRIPAVRGEDVCDASFTQNDTAIVILTRDGRILVYQIATQTVQVLPANVPLNCSFSSEFSPNGSWVALADYMNDQLGFIDIDARTAQASTVLFPPVANAGADIVLEDTDGDGVGELMVNGLESLDSDGEIVSYVWSREGVTRPEGAIESLRFGLGVTILTLTVTDNDGLSDADDIRVILNPPPTTP